MVSTVGEIFFSLIEVCQYGKYNWHVPIHVGCSIKVFAYQSSYVYTKATIAIVMVSASVEETVQNPRRVLGEDSKVGGRLQG